mgnify:CR=1 FL=1
MAVAAKGAKRPTSNLRAVLMPFQRINVAFGRSARDDAAMLGRQLLALPRRDRAILHLRYTEGKSFEEISELLDMPVGTAKSLVFRAKAELRRNMERDGHEV